MIVYSSLGSMERIFEAIKATRSGINGSLVYGGFLGIAFGTLLGLAWHFVDSDSISLVDYFVLEIYLAFALGVFLFLASKSVVDLTKNIPRAARIEIDNDIRKSQAIALRVEELLNSLEVREPAISLDGLVSELIKITFSFSGFAFATIATCIALHDPANPDFSKNNINTLGGYLQVFGVYFIAASLLLGNSLTIAVWNYQNFYKDNLYRIAPDTSLAPHEDHFSDEEAIEFDEIISKVNGKGTKWLRFCSYEHKGIFKRIGYFEFVLRREEEKSQSKAVIDFYSDIPSILERYRSNKTRFVTSVMEKVNLRINEWRERMAFGVNLLGPFFGGALISVGILIQVYATNIRDIVLYVAH